jgi:quercetin dioxygenase-like cupin family protein
VGLAFHHGFFRTPSDVLDDVKSNGTWPTTFVSGPSEGLPTHWHSEEVHAYIMQGETDFLDLESGERTKVKPGDKIIVPARTPHAEGAVRDKVVYILALPAPLPPEEFLKMRPLEELSG